MESKSSQYFIFVATYFYFEEVMKIWEKQKFGLNLHILPAECSLYFFIIRFKNLQNDYNR